MAARVLTVAERKRIIRGIEVAGSATAYAKATETSLSTIGRALAGARLQPAIARALLSGPGANANPTGRAA